MDWRGAQLSSSVANKRLPETLAKAQAMASRRIPPTLPGQQQPPSQSQPQQLTARGNDTSPTPAPAPTLASGGPPISPGQVIALVRDAWKKAAGSDGVRSVDPDNLITGITIDITGKNITSLPDEVIDILRNGVGR